MFAPGVTGVTTSCTVYFFNAFGSFKKIDYPRMVYLSIYLLSLSCAT